MKDKYLLVGNQIRHFLFFAFDDISLEELWTILKLEENTY